MPEVIDKPRDTRRRWLFGRREPGLTLTIDGATLRFDSPADLEFALRARTGVPGARLGALADLSLGDLMIEADAVKRTESHILKLIEQLLDRQLHARAALSRLGLQVFSHDHDWRSIVEQVQKGGADMDPWRRLVLVKYLQYLGGRQDVLRTYHLLKATHDEADDTDMAGPADSIETDMFEQSMLEAGSEDFTRLARAEPTLVRLPKEAPLQLRLGRLPVEICAGPVPLLQVPGLPAMPLRPGANVIGRSRHVDICLEGGFPTVSRRHLVIDLMAHQQALLTDLSSRGTFVPRTALPD